MSNGKIAAGKKRGKRRPQQECELSLATHSLKLACKRNDTEVQLEQAELALCVFMQVVIGLGVFGKGPYQEKAVFWTPFSLCQSTQCSPHPQAILPFHYISSLKLGFECLFMPGVMLHLVNTKMMKTS